MKLIDRGLQFSVFNDPDNSERVLKIPNDISTAKTVLDGWKSMSNLSDDEKIEWAQRSAQDTEVSISYFVTLLGKFPELKVHLANPDFKNDGSYTQDKVTILNEYLHNCDVNAAQKIFESYAKSILYEWEYGFSEGVFNPTRNSGINSMNHIVLVDFLEINTLKIDVASKIKQKYWLSQSTYIKDMPSMFRREYKLIMEKYITLKTLDVHWRLKLVNN